MGRDSGHNGAAVPAGKQSPGPSRTRRSPHARTAAPDRLRATSPAPSLRRAACWEKEFALGAARIGQGGPALRVPECPVS